MVNSGIKYIFYVMVENLFYMGFPCRENKIKCWLLFPIYEVVVLYSLISPGNNFQVNFSERLSSLPLTLIYPGMFLLAKENQL